MNQHIDFTKNPSCTYELLILTQDIAANGIISGASITNITTQGNERYYHGIWTSDSLKIEFPSDSCNGFDSVIIAYNISEKNCTGIRILNHGAIVTRDTSTITTTIAIQAPPTTVPPIIYPIPLPVGTTLNISNGWSIDFIQSISGQRFKDTKNIPTGVYTVRSTNATNGDENYSKLIIQN